MIEPFKPHHLLQIRYQLSQAGAAQTLEHAEAVATGWCAYTAFAKGSAQPLACAGIMEIWPGRAMAWAALDFEAGQVIVEATRHARKELDKAPFPRVEMYVRPGFAEGWRWAAMLGFSLESIMKMGAPDGSNLLVLTRFKQSRAYRDLAWNSRSSLSVPLKQSVQ